VVEIIKLTLLTLQGQSQGQVLYSLDVDRTATDRLLNNCVVRSGILRGVGEGQHQCDADLRAPGRPHLRQDVQESGRQHDSAQQPADEAPDGSERCPGCRRRTGWST